VVGSTRSCLPPGGTLICRNNCAALWRTLTMMILFINCCGMPHTPKFCCCFKRIEPETVTNCFSCCKQSECCVVLCCVCSQAAHVQPLVAGSQQITLQTHRHRHHPLTSILMLILILRC